MPQNLLVNKSTKVSKRLKRSSQLPLSWWKEYQPWPFLGSSGHLWSYHHFNVTVDHWKLQIHGITLKLKSSDTRASFVKTHSQATPEDHVKVTQEQYELYCEMGSTFQVRLWHARDCGIVRFWRGEIVRLSRKKFLNWWNSHLPPNRQQRGYDATEQFSLFIDKFCHVENFFIRCRAMCAFCTHFSETTIYCGLD